MELFSEIYSCYYKVVAKILNTSLNNPLSKTQITEIINKEGFSESAFYILPKLFDGDWNLMNNTDNKYLSKLEGKVKLPITKLEKAWLKSLLSDKRIGLFLSDNQIEFSKDYLKDIEPLFNINDFYYYDTYLDGDDYANETYIKNFRTILTALKSKALVTISFDSSKNGSKAGSYFPYKIEYSSKDDKFRVHTVRLRNGKIVNASVINISRISEVELSKESFQHTPAIDHYIKHRKYADSVVIEISKERNAVERCMLHFANFEKRTEYDENTDKYICHIYYNKQDETELLIRILSFGPVIKVLGPDKFLTLIRDRVKRQAELLRI